MPPDQQPANLQQIFSDNPYTNHPSTWNALYQKSFHPWDRNGPSLALSELLSSRDNLIPPPQPHLSRYGGSPLRSPLSGQALRKDKAHRKEMMKKRKKTALVPGCGRGHDVLLLAAFGYDVWGLDVAAEGTKLARENEVLERGKEGSLFGKGCVVAEMERGRVHWITGDFFTDGWRRDVVEQRRNDIDDDDDDDEEGEGGVEKHEEGKFDLIFDYTFLCALPPQARPSWAKRMSQLISNDGRLICLEFPSGKPLSMAGPPWGLYPEVYEALLAEPGEDVSYDDIGNAILAPTMKPHEGALHRLTLVKPQKTHEAGTAEDGTVVDFISVWSL